MPSRVEVNAARNCPGARKKTGLPEAIAATYRGWKMNASGALGGDKRTAFLPAGETSFFFFDVTFAFTCCFFAWRPLRRPKVPIDEETKNVSKNRTRRASAADECVLRDSNGPAGAESRGSYRRGELPWGEKKNWLSAGFPGDIPRARRECERCVGEEDKTPASLGAD